MTVSRAEVLALAAELVANDHLRRHMLVTTSTSSRRRTTSAVTAGSPPIYSRSDTPARPSSTR
jgi:hypothetical protein